VCLPSGVILDIVTYGLQCCSRRQAPQTQRQSSSFTQLHPYQHLRTSCRTYDCRALRSAGDMSGHSRSAASRSVMAAWKRAMSLAECSRMCLHAGIASGLLRNAKSKLDACRCMPGFCSWTHACSTTCCAASIPMQGCWRLRQALWQRWAGQAATQWLLALLLCCAFWLTLAAARWRWPVPREDKADASAVLSHRKTRSMMIADDVCDILDD
jgi:hypothetical protein